MTNFNKVMIMGRLTRDIELRHTPNTNSAVANIGLAVNRRYRTSDGEQRDETTYVDCEAWGRTAEIMNQYLQKGRPVFVEGRLKLDQWQDKEGSNRSKLKVVIENFQFIDSRAEAQAQAQAGGPPGGGRGADPGAGQRTAVPAGAPAPAEHAPINEDDIPF